MTYEVSQDEMCVSFDRKVAVHNIDKTGYKAWKAKVEDWHRFPGICAYEDFSRVFIFCDANFGDNWVWSTIDGDRMVVYIKNEDDAIMFRLSHDIEYPAPPDVPDL